MKISHGSASVDVSAFGAMVVAAQLDLGDGTLIRPFFENPWRYDRRNLDPFDRRLGAEWPCVPFGRPQAPEGLPDDWTLKDDPESWSHTIHGYGAHNAWTLTRDGPAALVAQITYPDSAPIRHVRRRIALVDPQTIAFSLQIEARQPIQIGVAAHPILSLADLEPGTARLAVSGQNTVWSYPVDVEPGRSRFKPDQRAVPLTNVMDVGGRPVDATRLPLDGRTEDLLLLTQPDGAVELSVPPKGYAVRVQWVAKDFPSCVLWFSNRGRDYAPWDGRVCALGVEPAAAAFDLGEPHNRSTSTPLARAGVRTAIDLVPDRPWETRYTVSVRKLPAAEKEGEAA